MARIVIESGPQRGQTLALPEGQVVRIGRDAGCFLRLADERASRVHCVVGRAGKHYVLKDQSRNGTFVNGKRIERAVLQSGDMVAAGETFFSFFDDVEDPLLGTTVGGYRIERRLGRGGMGTVYQATQVSLDRPVALKILSAELSEDREFVRRFLQEAWSAGRLNHPNVVQVHDAGKHGDTYYLSMEYMEGGSLETLLERDGKLAPRVVIPLMLDAAEALDWAEVHGIVHRDIKPDNLLLDRDGCLKIGDFGIAADLRRSKTSMATGKLMGTPQYMAPEQALGKPLDHRADMYALGCTLYKALAGVPPFEGETPVEVLLNKVRKHPRPLATVAPELPPSLVALVEKMMARRPEDRFQSARELAGALAPVESAVATEMPGTGGRSAARPSAPPEPRPGDTTRVPGGRPRIIVASLGGLAGAAALAALLVFLVSRPEPEPALDPALETPLADVRPVEPLAGAPAGAPGAARPEPVAPPAMDAVDEVPEPPPADPPELAREGADPAVELARLREAVARGRVSLEEGQRRLDDFARRYPEQEWDAPIASVERALRAARAERLEEERRELRELVAGTIEPLASRSEFVKALEKLAAFGGTHGLVPEDVAKEDARIRQQAEKTFEALRMQAGDLMLQGDFDGARGVIAPLGDRLPPAAAEDARKFLDEITRAETTRREIDQALELAREKSAEAFRTLEFQPAREALAELELSADPQVRDEARNLLYEVLAFEQALTKLAEGIRALGTVADPTGQTQRTVKVVGVTGLDLKFERARGREETVRLPELEPGVLAGFLSGGASAATSLEALPPDLAEELGVFLLRTGQPGRAWKLLTRPEVPELRRKHYQEVLAKALRAGFSAGLRAVSERLRSESAGRAGFDGELEGLEQHLRDVALLAGASDLEADLAALYLECKRRSLYSRAPASLFHATRVDITGPNSVRMTYEFESEEELEDFLPVGGGQISIRRAPKGSLLLSGFYRYLRGNPFRDRLSVAAIVKPESRIAPEICIGLWTRDDEPLPEKIYPITELSLATPQLLLFGIGYSTGTSSINTVPYITGPRGEEILVPGDILFAAFRDVPSNRFGMCLWGRTHRGRPYPVAFSFKAAAGPGDRIEWQMGRETLPLEPRPSIGNASRMGSATLASRKDPVEYDSLVVEGEVGPFWVDDQVSFLAVKALQSIAPAYPYPDLSRPLEKTERGKPGVRLQRKHVHFSDGFGGKRHPDWEIVRSDPSHVSLSRRPGTLAIKTQQGSITNASTSARNLFLVKLPAAEEELEVTTRLLDFDPEEPVQQAGILLLQDEDNYVKGTLEWARGRRTFVLLREERGQPAYVENTTVPDAASMWLRVRKRGQTYFLLTSIDGELFTFAAEMNWAGKPSHAGLVAKNSHAKAPEIRAYFDHFEIASPADLPWKPADR